MDKKQEYRWARVEMQRIMAEKGKSPAGIRKALAEFDRREKERKERAK